MNNNKSKNKKILVFGDLHFPYHHEKTFEFLKQVKKIHKPDTIICTGDIIDNYALSYHEKNPDSTSAEQDFERTNQLLKELAGIFPKMTILQGNHDLLPIRKARTIGLPSRFVRSLNEVYNTPKTWDWKFEHNLVMSDGRNLMVRHSLKKSALEVAKHYNCCYIQGHYHEDLIIESINTTKQNVFGCTAGCLVDDKSMAMDYNKGNLKRPELGCVMITDGVLRVISMEENK